jgi:hypothetical protein
VPVEEERYLHGRLYILVYSFQLHWFFTQFSEIAKHCTLSQVYLGTSLLDPEDLKILNLGVTWNFSKGMGIPLTGDIMGHKGPVFKA